MEVPPCVGTTVIGWRGQQTPRYRYDHGTFQFDGDSMGYRHILITRWSRRDILAIVVIAVTIGFLTGTTLIITAASTQTTTIAKGYSSDGTAKYYDSVSAARSNAGDTSLVAPVAAVTLPNGDSRYVVGVPPQRVRSFRAGTSISIPPPPETGVTSGVKSSAGRQRLIGSRSKLAVEVTPRGSTHQFFPPDWYVTHPSLVKRLGSTGAFVITPAGGTSGSGIPERGVTLRSALAFFVAGTRQLLTVLGLTVVGSAILVGTTVFSVTRMTVSDRLQAIRVVRSTGGDPFTVVRSFALRAGGLTTAGVVLGYAIGVILPHVAVDVAVFAGLPTSLSVSVTERVLGVLLPMYVATILVGVVAGGIAVWPTIDRPPGRLTETMGRGGPRAGSKRGLRRFVSLRLLDWRALAPSVATLTVFAVVVVLVSSLAGVVGPLVTTQGTTVTEPGAIHPIASEVPIQYADALRAQGIPASPEILLFTVRNGQPFLARGANYSAFEAVSNATLERGRRPNASNEAVIGADLARTSGIEIGDRVPLGGSTQSGLEMVRVVGVYSAAGPYDDQLLVSLSVGQQLSGREKGTVNIIRTGAKLKHDATRPSVDVVGVSVPNRVSENTSVPVTIRARNFGSEKATRDVSVGFGNSTKTVPITLDPGQQRAVTTKLPSPGHGRTTIHVGRYTRTVAVTAEDSIQMQGLPNTAPPHSSPLVTVTTMDGDPVPNATIRVANDTVRTGHDGSVRLPLGSAGNHTVRVTTKNRTTSRTVRTRKSARRTLTADVRLHPRTPSMLSRTEARVRLYNPWNTTLERRIRLSGVSADAGHTVSVEPGSSRTTVFTIGRQSPGTYSADVLSEGHRLATTAYTVSGDERLVAAYASSGKRTGGTGISQALNTVFGNLQVLLGVLVVLAGMMTVGSTTAVFAQAVHARQRAVGIYRATGASPTRVFRLIVADAVVIGAIAIGSASLLGVVATVLLARLNVLVVYGVRITPTVSPSVVVGSLVGGLGIVLVSAGIVVGMYLVRQPTTLMRSDGVRGMKTTSRGDFDE